jgi:hypothetical protein
MPRHRLGGIVLAWRPRCVLASACGNTRAAGRERRSARAELRCRHRGDVALSGNRNARSAFLPHVPGMTPCLLQVVDLQKS